MPVTVPVLVLSDSSSSGRDRVVVPVPVDWFDGLVHEPPHAVVVAPAGTSAASRLAGTASAVMTAIAAK